ncbi:MAG TPA: co-chaperone GroES [Candidatus Paceibacterota bacterium]|nr:co-chaperone GroES [Candidatus Paceibacterota bacterium]
MAKMTTTKTRLIPLADRVIVQIAKEKKSASGLIIPETAGKEKPERGIVVAVGKGKKNDAGVYVPLEVNVGDDVVFSKYGPDEITVDGIVYFILREDQILAIVK